MGWFSSNILSTCSQEKDEQNQMVLQALAGIYIFFPMRRDFGARVTLYLFFCRSSVVLVDAGDWLHNGSEFFCLLLR
jgi:hypothetical protein